MPLLSRTCPSLLCDMEAESTVLDTKSLELGIFGHFGS